MKLQKYHQKFFSIFIILICLVFSKCDPDCNHCTIDSGLFCNSCNPDCVIRYGSNECFLCNGIANGDNGDHYSISSSCSLGGTTGSKIIYNGKYYEFTSADISSSDLLFKFGDYYYYISVIDTSLMDCENKLCKCQNFYYIDTPRGDMKLPVCYNSISDLLNAKPGYKYYNYKTGEFTQNSCPTDFDKMKILSSGAIRCTESCLGSEKIQEESSTSIYCVDQCDITSHYKYEYTDASGITKCLDSCPDNYYIKSYNSNQNYKCVTLDECNFYSDDTCYESCPAGKIYHKYGSKECISLSDCSNSENKYIDGNTCYKKEECAFVDSTSCVSSCSSSQYHAFDDNECLSICPSDKQRYANDGTDNKHVCYHSCADIPGGEYIYEGKNDPICHNTHPTTGCEYYYVKLDGVRKCTTLADCVNNNNNINQPIKRNYIINKECKESCDGYYQLEKTWESPAYIECFDTVEKMVNSNLGIHFCDTKLRKCWKDFPVNEEYYINTALSGSDDKIYEIVKECNNFYVEDRNPFQSYQSYWCVSTCGRNNKDFFESGNKECKSQCSDFGKYYYVSESKECVESCEIKQTKPYSYPVNKNRPDCQESCDYYYNYNSHTCLDHCGADNSKLLYHKKTGTDTNICFASCLDIPPRDYYLYVLSDNSCIQESERTTDCEYYYEFNGMRKCADLSLCISEGFNYLMEYSSNDIECSNKCKDGYVYQFERMVDSNKVIKCFQNVEGCQRELGTTSPPIYFHEKSKMCFDQYQPKYYIKSPDTNNYYELVDECDDFYYIKEDETLTPKYCTNLCNAQNLYFIQGDIKCIEGSVCVQYPNLKYYYDPSNNECINSCSGRTKYKYQVDFTSAPTTPIPCLETCETTTGTTTVKRYNNFDSNVCLDYCGADGSNKKYHANDKTLCYASCAEIPGSYLYELKQTNDYECSQNPYSDSSHPYYIVKNDGTLMYQNADECIAKNYNYLFGSECRKECDDYYKLKPESGDVPQLIQCYTAETDCPVNGGVKYYNKNLKQCWKTYPTDFYLVDQSSFEVVEKCEDFYYEDDSKKICTPNCKTKHKYFLKGKDICIGNCFSTYQKHYFNPDNYECLDTCKDLAINKFDDKITANTGSTSDILVRECKSSCDDYQYHDVDSNVCIEKCGDGDSNKIYHAEGKFICYTSCSVIPGGIYIYEKDNICYQSTSSTDCPYFYIKANGVKQCAQREDCINNNYKYFIEKECRENCDGYYKYETNEDIGGTTYTFIKCFGEIDDILDDDEEILFYNGKLQLVWNQFPRGYFIKEKKEISGPPVKNRYEVVEECDYFYYKFSDINVPNEDNDYNRCTDNDKCKEITRSSTDGLGLYFIKTQKNCETSCTAFNKHYYNPDNNECLDTCKGLANKEFAFKPTDGTSIQSCIEKCNVDSATPPTTTYYYDYDSNLCINKCGDDNENYLYISSNSNDKRCYPSCFDIPDGDYKFESVDDSDLIKTCYTSIPSNCDYYYTKKDGTLKCLGIDIIKCTDMKYNYLLGKECRSECNDFYTLEDDNTDGIKKCYKDVDECRSGINDGVGGGTQPIFYSTKLKKCWKNYPANYFISKTDKDTNNPSTIIGYEMVEECTYFYYYENVDSIKYNYCIEQCKRNPPTSNDPFFIEGKKNCEYSCAEFNKFYYDLTNNECLDTCIGRENKEFADKDNNDPKLPKKCINKCGDDNSNNIYYNYGENLCFNTQCNDATLNKFIESGNDKVCYNSCVEIPGRKNIYESESGNICYTIDELESKDCFFYYAKKDGTETMKCIPSDKTCKEMGLGFDFVLGKECRKNCDDYFKLMDEDSEHPEKNTIRCFETLDKALEYELTPKKIKFYNMQLKQCWFDYYDNLFILYDKMGVNNDLYEVVQKCESYYYEKVIEDNPTIIKYNYCVENCQKVNLFFKGDNNKCIQCEDYYDPTNNECLDTCLHRNNLEYSYPLDKTTTPINPRKCLNKCPYYFETKKDVDNTIIGYECVDTCPNPKYINTKTKECLPQCESNQYVFENLCYPECEDPSFKYIDTDTNECVLSCPSYLSKVFEISTSDESKSISLCKTKCTEDQFRLEEKCLPVCPPTHSYIGNNNICHSNIDKCNGDPNGEKYYPINADDVVDTNFPYYLYQCTDNCDKAKAEQTNGIIRNYFFYTMYEPNQCLSQCTQTYPNYLPDKHECIDKCPEDSFFYYKEALPADYTYHWECKNTNTCNDPPLYLDGKCVSKTECKNANKIFIDSLNRCLPKCKDGEIKQKNMDNREFDGTYTCQINCHTDFEDIDNDIIPKPECVSDCPKERNFIGKDNKCKKACDEEDGLNYYKYKYIEEDTVNNILAYYIYKCTIGCQFPYLYSQINNGNECYENCENTNSISYPYLSKYENLCYDNCLKSDKYFFTTKDPADSKDICSDKCELSTYKLYGKDKVCRDKCSDLPGENIIGLENKCVANCLSYSSAKYQLRGKCEEGCDPPDTTESPALIRYSPTDYICKAKCGIDENIVKDGKECVSKSSCNNFRNALYTVSDPNDYVEYECIESCFNINVNGNSVDKFYYEKDKICIDRCNQGDKVVQDINRCITKCDDLIDTVYNLKYYLYQKIDGDADIPYDMCVLKCPEKKPYIDTENSECVSKCPDTSRYYIQQFTHGEEDTRKKCLNDCPKEYPFYVIRESDGMKYYECIGTCDGFIVLNKDTNIKARRCLTNCPEDNYKFKIINETENKKYCYEKCPDEMYNIGGTTDDNNCYEICPEPSFYHKKGETECFSLSQLDNGIILYNKKEWRNDMDSCPRNYLTTKVEDETITTKDIYICSNECLEEFGLYLTTYGTCVKDCESSSLVQGFNLKNDVNNSICVCQKLYYRDEISRKIVCNENIPGTCGDFNPDYPIPLFGTNECLKYCSSNRILNPDEDICYEPGTPCSRVRPNTLLLESQDKKKCDCEFKFYFENNGKKICLGENDVCPESRKKYYPYPDTMECANSCKSGYYTFKNYCLKQCPSGSTINDDTMTCDCGNKFWYQVSEGNYECLPADCLDDFPLSSEDKECLKTCRNTYYPIYFQDKCFDECEGGLDKFPMNDNSPLSKYAQYYCNCSRPWYNELISDNEYVMHCPKASDDIKECKFYENGLINMIEETRECKATCPEKYPYLFNELCFTSCEYADEKYAFHIQKVENSYVCGCQNLWHKNMTDFDKKICYEKTRDECPIDIDQDSYGSYLILTTKQCVDSADECPPNFFRFNMICYDKCPEFTLEGKNEQNENICKCDKSHLWLKYEKYGNTYYKCGLDACPETSIGDLYTRKVLLESENQCVRSCTDEAPEGNEYLYSFRGKCVKDCPSLTKQVNDECQFYDIKSSGHVDDLDDLKEKANVQAKELYKEAGSYSGFIMHDFGASLQIYALNKIDSHRDLAMQSNLTYIDLGTCLDKIYADNNLEDTDNILVTKYDLLSRTHKSNNNDGNADGDAGEDATPSS